MLSYALLEQPVTAFDHFGVALPHVYSPLHCVFQAQRLAALERLVRKLTQQLAGGTPNNPQGTPGGAKDRPDERLLRRLGELLLVKQAWPYNST